MVGSHDLIVRPQQVVTHALLIAGTLVAAAASAAAQAQVAAWGSNSHSQSSVPGSVCVGVAAGASHSVTRLEDGSLLAWGRNDLGQLNVPTPPPGLTYVDVDAEGEHTLARLSDGSVTAWGYNGFGQCNVPAAPGLTYVDLAAGGWHTAARLSDGSVVAWGRNDEGQCSALDPPAGLAYVEIACGGYHSVARLEAVSGSTYCTAGTSASGCKASVSITGLPSASAPSGFFLSATNVEGAKDGLFFFGTSGRQAAPWGNGTSFQCVVPSVQRAGLLAGVGAAGACDGAFSQDLNARWCPTCPRPGHNPGAGTVVQAQLWYRAPLGTSNQTTSLSNAAEFAVRP